MNKRAFYLAQQGGCCYLRITPRCKRDPRMVEVPKHARQARCKSPSHKERRQLDCEVTWDHIFPKPRSSEDEQVQLLACYACNNKRNSTPATAAHIALALKMLEEWRAHANAPPGTKAKRRAERKAQRAKVRTMQLEQRLHEHAFYRAAEIEAREAGRPYCSLSNKRRLKRAAARREAKKHPKPPKTFGWSLEKERALSQQIRVDAEARAKRNAESQAAAQRAIASRARRIDKQKGPTR